MTEKKKNEAGAELLFADWMKSVTDFWGEMVKTEGGIPDIFGLPSSVKPKGIRQTQKSWETGSKIFQAVFSSFSSPENMEAFFKGTDTLPDFFTSVQRQAWDGIFDLQKKWMERMARIGQETKAYSFEDIDQETFKTLRKIYENEFRKFLHIPTLGLNRFQQERMNNLIDKYAIFRTSVSELLYMFYVPIEKTGAVMQEQIEEMAEKGELFTDFKDYYNMWIRILEGHYMTLLQSPEYTEVMDNAIQANVDYVKAKEAVMYDQLQKFPIPTNKDMDELCKDVYLLKKKVRELTKKLEGAPE
ncbi:MAG: poly(R)-hydroxyalkanoic acid synthase subunit PhaE [Desulfococcaceae bacterium]|jgi:polyhydroxyalkanoate synthesis regulator phasin|nr:poly(R)-hydroxyalkanoic acid synthase subunit PhaE [Desulfococcaceae bacterium]